MRAIKNEFQILYEIVFLHKVESCIICIVGLIGLFCFQFGDGKSLTAYSVEVWDSIFSGNLLNIPEFYHENIRNAPNAGIGFSGANFLISLPWAIWNFPLWLTHPLMENSNVLTTPCLIWSKCFLMFCSVLAGMRCYRIVYALTSDKGKGQLAAIFFWGSGTLALSIGYSMQDEIIYILLFLFALQYVIQGKSVLSVAFLILTNTLCPFMILPSLVIIIFRYKNIFTILLITIASLIPYVLFSILLPAVVPLNDDYLDWFFAKSLLSTGLGNISCFAVILLIVYTVVYFRKSENYDLVCLLAILMSVMCVLSWLHIYRYFLCVPFLLIALLSSGSKYESKMKMSLILFSAFECCRLLGALFFDRTSLEPISIAPWLKEHIAVVDSYSFIELLTIFIPSLGKISLLLSSAIVGLTILLLCQLKKNKHDMLVNIGLSIKTISMIYVLIPLIFFSSYFAILSRVTVFQVPIEEDDHLAPAITESISLNQYYYSSEKQNLRQVQVRTVTWDRVYPQDLSLRLEIIEADTKEVLGHTDVLANNMPNNGILSFDLPRIQLSAEHWYVFRLSAVGTVENEEQAIYLLHSDDGTARVQESYTTIKDSDIGAELTFDYNVCLKIIGWK